MSKKDKYLKQIYAIFIEYGVKNFTMEEIAEKIGITKMTIYNNFSSKDALIKEVVNYRENNYSLYISSVNNENSNAINHLFKVISFKKSNPHPTSFIFYSSLKTYYRDIYDNHMVNFKKHLRNFIVDNINKGVSEGIYIENIKAEPIAGYIVSAMDNMFDKLVTQEDNTNLNTLHMEMIIYHLRGIVNSKGIEILNNEIININ